MPAGEPALGLIVVSVIALIRAPWPQALIRTANRCRWLGSRSPGRGGCHDPASSRSQESCLRLQAGLSAPFDRPSKKIEGREPSQDPLLSFSTTLELDKIRVMDVITTHLNADFDGGEVSFPEYGPRGFKPGPGGAVVFSCSLLHAVSKVTRGARYAFLPFLYDDDAAELRAANAAEAEESQAQASLGPGTAA